MSGVDAQRVWVFHAGALGDFVLCWPLLRALRRAGAEVTVVAHGAKARLAERELGVRGVDIEGREWSGLWVKGGEQGPPTGGPIGGTMVVSFIVDETTAAGRTWIGNARRMLDAERVMCVGSPGSASRAAAWAWGRVAELGGVGARANPGGPVVCHVGAGSREKMWPLERWAELVGSLRGGSEGMRVEVIAGEVEAERFTRDERALFEAMGGEFEFDLLRLADRVRGVRLFIGADTGPTHLAAQLGVPTVALFGPTDPAVWGPVGPRAIALAPRVLCEMNWLLPRSVVGAVQRLLLEAASASASS